jgi:hypothetical protein
MRYLMFVFSLSVYGATFSTPVRFHTTELTIKDNNIAHDLWYGLMVQAKEYEYLPGHFYKNDEFVFCQYEPEEKYACHIYLKGEGTGELASHWVDTDYGKGSFVEYMTTKALEHKAEVEETTDGFKINLTGPIAERLWSKMNKVSLFWDGIMSGRGQAYRLCER